MDQETLVLDAIDPQTVGRASGNARNLTLPSSPSLHARPMQRTSWAAIALSIATLTVLSACKEEAGRETAMPAPPVLDLSTPDRAIKSHWAVVDWEEATARIRRDAFFQSAAGKQRLELLRSVRSEAIVEGRGKGPQETFEREIAEVKVETESRATILATIKNTTPIPPGAEPSKFDVTRREEGERYRYVLEKFDKDWRVAEIWTYVDYATKWDKTAPSTSIHVPSMTYNAR